MTKAELGRVYHHVLSDRKLWDAYYEFLDRGKYFPKEDRDADHLLRCRGKDMLGLQESSIEDIIKYGASKPFVGSMVLMELWR